MDDEDLGYKEGSLRTIDMFMHQIIGVDRWTKLKEEHDIRCKDKR